MQRRRGRYDGLTPEWLLRWLGRMRSRSREISRGLQADAAKPSRERQSLAFRGLGECPFVLRGHAEPQRLLFRPLGLGSGHVDTL
jgi:hypothetical protein